MNRAKAVAVCKEIMNLAESMGGNTFELRMSKEDDPTSQGYQICIRMAEDYEIKQQTKSIAEKHDLALKEENGDVIIYQLKNVGNTQ